MFQPGQEAFTIDRRRQLARASFDHVLRVASLIGATVEGDFLTALVLMTALRANVAEITSDPNLAVQFGRVDTVPPAEARRPVTIYAIAKQLGTPYETVRRHIHKLEADGFVVILSGGVLVSPAVLTRPEMINAVHDHLENARRYVSAAARIGAIEARPTAPVGDNSRQVTRLGIGFFLDSLALVQDISGMDAVSILVMASVGRMNITRFAEDPALDNAFSSLEVLPPDELRQPVSVYALAKALRLPYETVRRYANRLIKSGRLAKTPKGGLIVPSSLIGAERIMGAAVRFLVLAAAYLDQLAEAGVRPAA